MTTGEFFEQSLTQVVHKEGWGEGWGKARRGAERDRWEGREGQRQAIDAGDVSFATAAGILALERDVVLGSSTASSQQLLHALKEPLRICTSMATWTAEMYTLSHRDLLVTEGPFHVRTVFVEASQPAIKYTLARPVQPRSRC